MPLVNFLYLSLQNQDNEYLFYGLIISFILLIILREARRHHIRVARETGRTKIKEMAEDIEVVTIVKNEVQKNYVELQYFIHGINLDHCSFLIAPTNSYWTRD